MDEHEIEGYVDKAANAVAFEWPGVVDAEDLRQDIWVRLLESPKWQENVRDADPALKVDILKRLATQIASDCANDYERFSGNAFYGTNHVRYLLESGVLTIDRDELSTTSETLTEFIDTHDAYAALQSRSPQYSEIIWQCFVLKTFDKNTSTARSQLSRAVRAMTDLMNQANRRRVAEYEHGPGSRAVVSNEKARMLSQQTYSGGGEHFNTFAQ
ncbi:RNA polymerase sigma factor [Actinopolyspora erythraea]|uniref:hypothetical protein n=1 Tax=Actinopolyspora erythraea TaxID=414996 RepID=UPI0011858586|nr:hypothetical protein [Actinopolyspora erythraea]